MKKIVIVSFIVILLAGCYPDVRVTYSPVVARQDIIEQPDNFDTFNFYVYKNTAAGTGSCGTVHADTDMPWRDDDAILHVAHFTDCTHRHVS